jgi:soluble lytic murein transglycosylase-like protein
MTSRHSLRVAVTVLAAIALVAGCGQVLGRSHGTVPGELVPIFRDAAATYGILSAAQLAAQARVESKFNTRAVSRAGARGIMQFLPATWAAFGFDGDNDGLADPLDPQDAIPAAARYEAHLAEQVGGLPGDDVSLVLAAYNAGPDAVRAARGIPNFDETRAYVQKVQDWAAAYRGQL